MAQKQRIPPVMQETQEMWVQPMSWEDSLEEEMGQKSLVGYSPKGSQRVGHD